jgi:hypothetical protein
MLLYDKPWGDGYFRYDILSHLTTFTTQREFFERLMKELNSTENSVTKSMYAFTHKVTLLKIFRVLQVFLLWKTEFDMDDELYQQLLEYLENTPISLKEVQLIKESQQQVQTTPTQSINHG